MPSDPSKMTANLKAPLIFNLKNRKGRQIILNSSEYMTRHNIMEEMKKHASDPEKTSLQDVIDQNKNEKLQAKKIKQEKS